MVLNIKRFALILGCVTLIASIAFAAAPGRSLGNKQVRKANNVHAQKALNLTPEQKSLIHDIRVKSREEAKTIKQSNLPPVEKRKALAELRQNTRAHVAALLTPVQKEKGEKLQKARLSRKIEKLRLRRAMVDMTPEQRADVTSIMKLSREQAKAIKQDKSLSPTEKRQRLQALRKDTMAKIRAISGK